MGRAENYRGEGIKVAVIDTGIDYTHANFGGPGTPTDYTTAHASETAPKPGVFRAVGAESEGRLRPRRRRLHGFEHTRTPTRTRLIATGTVHTSPARRPVSALPLAGRPTRSLQPEYLYPRCVHDRPGCSPESGPLLYRVFGCTGSTNVTVDAIDMAVDDGVDVINMSLGSPFGTADDASAVAATNAANAGVIVVASSGNNGKNQYLVGSPSTGTG